MTTEWRRIEVTAWSRIVEVRPMTAGWGQVIGTVVPVVLDCGHIQQGNPTMTHKVGELVRCHQCDIAERA